MVGTSRRGVTIAVLVVVTAAAASLTACRGGVDVVGRLTVSGSSTVEPISTRVAELFEDVTPEILVDVDGPGTGDGFQLFCAGDAHVANASRPIQPAEVEQCREHGIEFIELPVAYDGLTVMTNGDDDQVACLTMADLYALMGPESDDVDRWRDAEPLARELGSDTPLPARDLDIFAPGQESGTYDAFVELALEDLAAERLAGGHLEPAPNDPEQPERLIREFPGQSDDNVILAGIGGSPGSFGWVGFAFAQGGGDDVRSIAVDGGAGCVEPSIDTIADGSYPLARLLYVYVSVPALTEEPALVDYIDFYLSDGGQAAVPEVGYVALSADDLAASRTAWADRRTGTRDGGR